MRRTAKEAGGLPGKIGLDSQSVLKSDLAKAIYPIEQNPPLACRTHSHYGWHHFDPGCVANSRIQILISSKSTAKAMLNRLAAIKIVREEAPRQIPWIPVTLEAKCIDYVKKRISAPSRLTPRIFLALSLSSSLPKTPICMQIWIILHFGGT